MLAPADADKLNERTAFKSAFVKSDAKTATLTISLAAIEALYFWLKLTSLKLAEPDANLPVPTAVTAVNPAPPSVVRVTVAELIE